MKRLIITGALAVTLAGCGVEVLTADIGGALTASNGPIVSYTPKPPAPCATNMAGAKAAAATAQGVLTVDHQDARISASQLKTLSDDLTQDAKSAEAGGDWGGLCADIHGIEAKAKSE